MNIYINRYRKRKDMIHHRHVIAGLGLVAMLLLGGTASAQVLIKENVYGGCKIGQVEGNTTVTVNDGTVGMKLSLSERKIGDNAQVTRVHQGNVYGGGNGYAEDYDSSSGAAPSFGLNDGRVTGNTTVTVGVSGDDNYKPVVRRAVYGGGNIATVGTCTFADTDADVPTYTSGGKAMVTITGKALIGPRVEDLIKDDAGNALTPAEIDTNFKYLGGNEGWVFGGSQGFSGSELKQFSFVDTTIVLITGNAQVMSVYGGGENGHVKKGTNVTINGSAIVGGVPLHGTSTPAEYTVDGGEYDGSKLHLTATEGELVEDRYGVGRMIYRGNVFGGGKGTDFVAWLSPSQYSYTSGRVYGNTHLTIEGSAKVYNRVYGGGPIASVGTFEHEDPTNEHAVTGIASGGHAYVTINGGTIGSLYEDELAHLTGCNNGDVYGGGRGVPGRPKKNSSEAIGPLNQVLDLAYVGHTHVVVDGGTVLNSVYGGAANGHVQGNTNVLIKETVANTTKIGYTLGGWHGNVYAGGGGTARYTENGKKFSITAGRVYGNTYLTIEGGTIYHNVYGGGSLASVGTYLSYKGQTQAYFGGGIATINITGGTIGTDGNENGMVFGSGRGEIAPPDNIMDTLTYMAYTYVNIGSGTVDPSTGNASDLAGSAQIKGSVYGSGENGHVYLKAKVNVFGGTIGCPASDYNTYAADPATYATQLANFKNRGNVYGAGCGTDKYDTDDDGKGDTYNPNSGYVWGQTEVNIYGGYISRSVYGGGAMGSVGLINHSKTYAHLNTPAMVVDSASLSWPYNLTYIQIPDSTSTTPNYPENGLTGKATVNIRGGHIGTVAAPVAASGNIFGSARGDVGPLGVMDSLAIVRETEVNINFTPSVTSYANVTDATANVIIGSVYGSGEDGSVYEDTKVTVTKGLIGGSVFGGGSGTTTYKGDLMNDKGTQDPGDDELEHNVDLRSITAGKVYGNTEVIINGGYITHNVYGGGNLASVGKGNYIGYGEMANADVPATPYLNSGKTKVVIKGGTIGTTGLADAQGIVNGFVYGSSKGTTFPTVYNPTGRPRYDYSRDFFLGYSNKTEVVIGSTSGGGTPRIFGSVFGGGENGHVRWNTDVAINKGEIGVSYSGDGSAASLASNDWVYRGNVYGAGRGIDYIPNTTSYCSSAGSVTLNTTVTVRGGTIHRNVYGGGSLASVGPPPTGYNPGSSLCQVNINGGTIGQFVNRTTPHTTDTLYGGHIYGASRGILGVNFAMYGTATNTEVNLDSVARIPGNVYGGGELGQVKKNTAVNIAENNYANNEQVFVGTLAYRYKAHTSTGDIDSVYHKTGGSVFGGGRGDRSNRDAALVGDSTIVTIRGGHVYHSVYGGGELASVGSRESADYLNKFNGGTTDITFIDFKPKQSKTGVDSTGVTIVNIFGGQVGPAPRKGGGYNIPIGLSGTDGYVFGGGKGVGEDPIDLVASVTDLKPSNVYSGKHYSEFADVNNTYVTIDMPMPTPTDDTTNRIWGSSFGGAEDGHVLGSARTYYISGLMGTDGTTSYDGNIFGGGRNYSKKNYNAGRVRINDTVVMSGGQIYGSIFGGGRLALTGIDLYGNIIPDNGDDKYGNTYVKVEGGTVGNDTEVTGVPGLGDVPFIVTFTKHPMGDVYGGGKGSMEGIANHPAASALLVSLVKNTEVIITDSIKNNSVTRSPKILGSVFGGGEVANVGQFTWKMFAPDPGHPTDITIGDIESVEGTGITRVTISGGQIGLDRMRMNYQIVGGEGTDKYNLKYNSDLGHVFGGGEGLVANPANYDIINPPSSGSGDIHSNKSLLDLMATVGETHVTISNTTNSSDEIGSAWVKGSVYGGSMSGHVMRDTEVTVSGGTIGAGKGTTEDLKHVAGNEKGKLFNPLTMTDAFLTTGTNAGDVDPEYALAECDHWPYDRNTNRPFDPVKLKTDATYTPSNGQSWYGNVFGGGSGFYPYIGRNQADDADSAIWNPECGKVYGNATVNITGGHILTNVYGGAETSDVGHYVYKPTTKLISCSSGGKATVTMSGGTVGVPRTKSQIENHPVTCYLFGAGKGDARENFNLITNVDSTSVVICDAAIVYGSVFGGAEDGHVVDNALVKIKKTGSSATAPVIGTTGFSGYDGHVFGSGKGNEFKFVGDTIANFAAGRVGGNTRVKVSNGNILGNLYGGGFIAHTGVGVKGDYESFVDTAPNPQEYDSTNHGMTKVELCGGVIGNPRNNGSYLLKSEHKSGNVYGGGRGSSFEYFEDDFGRVANSAVEITSNPTIYGSVFGGGQMANIGHWNNYDLWYTKFTSTATVDIQGSPSIGTALEFDHANYSTDFKTVYDTIHGVRMLSHTRTGNVYGGGQGDIVTYVEAGQTKAKGFEQGHCGVAEVTISGTPTIMSCVFGGSEQGAVWGNTEVNISGGTIGLQDRVSDSLELNSSGQWVPYSPAKTGTYSFGSVYGGSYGMDSYIHLNEADPTVVDTINSYAGRVYGNATVNISGGFVRGNVYGGGDLAGVFEKKNGNIINGRCTVNVSGSAQIGPLDGTGLNANVFGGGKGYHDSHDQKRRKYANVASTKVDINGGTVCGNVFGGSAFGHVFNDATVEVHNGTVGHTALEGDGNVFGGGLGYGDVIVVNDNGTPSDPDDDIEEFRIVKHCGRVGGNTSVTMDGGTVKASIYGGGSLALSGVDEDGVFDPTVEGFNVANHGNATISVSNGTIGLSDYSTLLGSDYSIGDIFGSGGGDGNYEDVEAGRVTNSTITISQPDGKTTTIYGSVFGGGELAGIGWWPTFGTNINKFYDGTGASNITINGGTIGSAGEYELTPSTSPDQWTVFDDETDLLMHTCTGNVFGGSQGDVNIEAPHWVSMGRSKTATVTVNGGTIRSAVFGGGEQGATIGDTHVTINDGTIGTYVDSGTGATDPYYFGGVFGGGFGSQNPLYNVNTYPNDSTISGHPWTADQLAGRVYGDVEVKVLGGTIQGDVFGGASFAYIGGYGDNPKGDVLVYIGDDTQTDPAVGTTILGSVYGANNRRGTPFGNVYVHVWHTKHTENATHTNFAPDQPEGGWTHELLMANVNGTTPFLKKQAYAIKEVFGGGNRASYTPNPGTRTEVPRSATVHVHTCDNTIEDLYGGGNAAHVGSNGVHANTNLLVDGGRFERVFGGGNGERGVAANIYGTANTIVYGGVMEELFGGSNTNGSILEIVVNKDATGTCSKFIDHFFPGNNQSDQYGDIVTNINCGSGDNTYVYGGSSHGQIMGNVTLNVYGGTITHLYGGSKGADIVRFPTVEEYNDPTAAWPQALIDYLATVPGGINAVAGQGGNVTVNLFGGTITNVYGGNEEGGKIQGKITINVIDKEYVDNNSTPEDPSDDVHCELHVTSIHGAGNEADYKPEIATITSPVINVVHIKDDYGITGSVYGGGKQASATSNPKVNIGYDAATMAADIPQEFKDIMPATRHILVGGNVYGGGENGDVTGNPTVILHNDNGVVTGDVFGGGCGNSGIPDVAKVEGNSTVTINGGMVNRHVFGGGSVGKVTGDTWVEMSAGQVNMNVYGGGAGESSSVGLGHVEGNSKVSVSGSAFIKGNLYGGGSLGQVYQDATVEVSGGEVGAMKYTWKHGTPDTQPYDSAVHVTTEGGTYGGHVFGGGQGMNTDTEFGLVKGNTNVTLSGGHVYFNVYGGGEMGSVGLSESYEYTGEINGSSVTLTDYRPKKDANDDMTGIATVTIKGGQVGPAPVIIKKKHEPSVDSVNVSIALNGVDGYVFGGGKGNGNDPISSFNPTVYPYSGRYYNFADVNYTKLTVEMDDWDPDHDKYNRIWGSIFGGAEDGHVLGNASVKYVAGLMGTTGTTSYDGNIFGGGRNYSKKNYNAGRVRGNIKVEMNGGQLYGTIFGGGRLALTGIDQFGNIIPDDAEGTGTKYGSVYVKVNGGIVGNNTLTHANPYDSFETVVDTCTTYSIGEVYGGGKGSMVGIEGHPVASALLVSLVKNTEVVIADSIDGGVVSSPRIYGSVFGGGEVANVGHFTWNISTTTGITNIDYKPGTGKAKVTVSGGTIGAERMKMRYTLAKTTPTKPEDFRLKYHDDVGNVFGGGAGITDNPNQAKYGVTTPGSGINTKNYGNKSLLNLMATVVSTEVTITKTNYGRPWVKSSVYGGSGSGRVMGDTWVKIQGGVIGAGNNTVDNRDEFYAEDKFINPLTDPIVPLYECVSWNYASPYTPFDLVEISKGNYPSDGKTILGNVFGGGSGYYPYITEPSTGVFKTNWNREAGKVFGNARLDISGGHILTSVYGGCETSDVGLYSYSNEIHGEVHDVSVLTNNGTATVTMTGGTVGVPRSLSQIEEHPVTCYLFGAGKGDPRLYFNTWTNVQKAVVNVSNSDPAVPTIIYGSVFGGGEEGHVLGDVDLDVSQASGKTTVIGTWGYSYVDGNIFGGGRGFTGDALTAGTVSGNIDVNITGGTMLGSVYGGGRLASVGTYLVDAVIENPDPTTSSDPTIQNPYYGKMREGNDHGFINVTISGGTIGNDHETSTLTHDNPDTKGGNVFGGCMGKFVAKVEGGETPIWPSLARAKQTEVTISGTALVKNSVFGGGEIGTVRDDATVNIEGGTIGGTYNGLNCGHVFGGGKGLDHPQNSFDTQNDSTMAAGYLAGRVYGNTYVNISGGHIYENIFGGGEVASVGWVDGSGNLKNGHCAVTMTGGKVGELDGSGRNAYIFGGPKGGSNGNMRTFCNVNSTSVEVDYEDNANNRVYGSLFGGGSDGHVLGNTSVTLANGTIGTSGSTTWDGNIFGGGRNYRELSLTAGRVGGNITVEMTGGKLYGSIFGGGRQGLTGVDVDGNPVDDANHGNITVTVSDGIVGLGTTEKADGHVFGGGKGQSNSKDDPFEYKRLGESRSTNVLITGTAEVNGSVYGGSENGRVLKNTTVTVSGEAVIGSAANELKGNVFGGGRGIDTDINPANVGAYNPNAGRVLGQARANVSGGTIKRHVFGGGDMGIVEQERIVNIDEVDPLEPTTINGSVFGGSNTIPVADAAHGKLKTVNVRRGSILGSVYGGSYNANEGWAPANPGDWATGARYWSSFVNITGGSIGQNVYGAGYGGAVNGSVSVAVGLTAVKNAPTYVNSEDDPLVQANTFYRDGLSDDPELDKVVIGGNVFGGSFQIPGSGAPSWNHNPDIEGYSTLFIDGSGYNTQSSDPASIRYMNIAGGVYGSGNYCESGKKGREIIIRNYGQRSMTGDEMTDATRTLKTLQRGGVVLLDQSNIHFSGDADISGQYPERNFGVLQVSLALYVANGSSIVLGNTTIPAYMDSIRSVSSLYLKDGVGSSYNQMGAGSAGNWEMVGIYPGNTNTLYRIKGTDDIVALTPQGENVILFNNDSRLFVRYKNNSDGKVYYGQLRGFFRMRADKFLPNGMEGFARSRPKLTNNVNPIPEQSNQNTGDGGFLSYNTTYNTFVTHGQVVLGYEYEGPEGNDGGDDYTFSKQYPYFNISSLSKMGDRADLEEYREWVLPKLEGKMWYVDGTRSWGRDLTHANKWGDYPDMPKQTISGTLGIINDPDPSSINEKFNPKKDIIFVVGAISGDLENEYLNLTMHDSDPDNDALLKLFRYPGGHTMSNGLDDNGGGSPNGTPNIGLYGTTRTDGPGVNTGAMIIADETSDDFVMENVVVDGLYEDNFTETEVNQYIIPDTYYQGGSPEKLNVNEPLVVATGNLTLKDNTILQRGYNKTDASGTDIEGDKKNYFVNPDFVSATTHNGAGMFVAPSATVKLEGLVNIVGNRQKNGSDVIPSNVYLSTFGTHLVLSGTLNPSTHIGITNPIRNQQTNYRYNTFSPVATANSGDAAADVTIAATAYGNDNFADDLGRYFVNGYSSGTPRRAYYSTTIPDYPGFIEEAHTTAIDKTKTLFFGWTWANVVLAAPTGYNDEDATVVIDSKEDLAWLASRVNGLNGQSGISMSTKTVTQTADLDMQQYVWVPVGNSTKPFSGTYDGRGHLIQNLSVDYIGTGDRIYQYNNYGLFGWVDNGTIDRTFVVSGIIRPEGDVNIGGLAGMLQSSTLKNSEAALRIVVPEQTGGGYLFSGGLVGNAGDATIHSSMAMPEIECAGHYGFVGGLLGGNTGTASNVLNSFANAKFSINNDMTGGAGGLVGSSENTTMKNCYIHLYDKGNLDDTGDKKKFGLLVASGASSTNIVHCYAFNLSDYGFVTHTDYALAYNQEGLSPSLCGKYSPAFDSDTYGYLCRDIAVEVAGVTKPMYQWLNDNINKPIVDGGLGGSLEYARWTRPTLSEINGDFPVPMLCNYDGSVIGAGDFRSVATYGTTKALQYGGTVRDGTELSTMLGRSEKVFVYGDIEEDLSSATLNAPKVAVYQDAAIMKPGVLGESAANVYVGVVFDNSSNGAGHDAYGNSLPRDWHMFSTPLANAPLGIDYDGDVSVHNPYVPVSSGNPALPVYDFTAASVSDGYFPSKVWTNYENNKDNYLYPYDFRTWYEPAWQWINFKRNGPSHWHFDMDPSTNEHYHINYQACVGATENVNETELVVGKGYMMSIQDATYLQSHGKLNKGNKPFTLTCSKDDPSNIWTWVPEAFSYYGNNFVGNPYHAYLDFTKFGTANGFSSYYIYAADDVGSGAKDETHGGYMMYAAGGSRNGYYASGYLHPHQGFFLQTTDAEKTVTFKDTDVDPDKVQIVTRAVAGDSFFRDRPAYRLVNLFAYDPEGNGDVVVIEFDRPENGGGQKVKALRNGNHLIYAHHDTTDYGAFFAEEGTRKVPVRFRSYEEQSTVYTLKWNLQNGYFPTLYLVDNMTGTYYDMTRNDTYTFLASKEDYLSRFYITFDYLDVEENEVETFVFFDGSSWVVNGKGYVELFDMTGRCLYTNTLTGDQSHLYFDRFAKGVYTLRLTDGKTVRIQKIVKQ